MKYEEAVKKTVDFWIEKSFKTPMNQNNGDDSNAMVFMLMNMNSSKAQSAVTEDKIKLFDEKLTELLLSKNDDCSLDVDYGPCDTLYQAAKYADIDCGCFPCKTVTLIQKEGNEFIALAKYQYGSPFKKL